MPARQLDLALALVARDLDLGPQHRVDRRDLDRVDQVLAAHRPAPHLEAEVAAEESLEDVLDRAEAAAGAEAAAAQAVVAVGVVGAAPLGVGEHLVGFRRGLELLLGLGVVVVDVGVQLAGEAAKRAS